MSTQLDIPVIPDDIARAAVLPTSYKDESYLEAYAWLRANMPFGRAEIEGYDPIWLVAKHADIMEIERNAATFHNGDLNNILQNQASDEFQTMLAGGTIRVLDSLTYMDAPEHTAVRGITKDWFMPARIRPYEDAMRRHAGEAVERLLSIDGDFDFVREFALHYPLRVIMSLFGVPRADEPLMLGLTQDFFGTQDPDEQAAAGLAMDPTAAAQQWKTAIDGFHDYFTALSDERRRKPTGDLLSLIANATLDGEPLAQSIQNGYYVAIAAAGHDTTSASIAGGLLGMLRHPEAWDAVKADEKLIPGLVEESIRYTSPVKHFMRNTTEAVEFRGQQLQPMERLMLLYGSGNRDEDVFDRPDVFDPSRRPNKHIGFGYGPHMCIGQHIAKLETRILWQELLPKIASFEAAGDPAWLQTNFVGGLKTLPVCYRSA